MRTLQTKRKKQMSNRDYYFIPEEIGKLKKRNAEAIADNKYKIKENGLLITIEKVNGQYVASVTDVLEYFTGTATESAMDSAIIGAMQNYQYKVKRVRMALAGCEIGIQLLKDMEYFK